MNTTKILIVPILGLMVACATPSQVAQESQEEFFAQTIDYVKGCTTISGQNDPLEQFIKVTTENCYHAVSGMLRMKWDDQVLRVFVDKESKEIGTLQVYTSFYSPDWAFPNTANFLLNGELNTVSGDRIASDVDCSLSSTLGHCIHNEHFAFEVDANELFLTAKSLKENGDVIWQYRIKTRSAGDKDKMIHVNEILGVQEVIESL